MYERLKAARTEYSKNEPPVTVDQVWHACGEDGTVMRRIRIVAPYLSSPEIHIGDNPGRHWIFQELPGGKFRLEVGRLGLTPELNLRYVFTPEDNDG